VTVYKKERSKWTTKHINHHLNERNQDISTNQKKMINSILKRKSQKIILNRLLLKDDPNIIKTETINYFQKLFSSTDSIIYHSIQDLPTDWKNIYDQSKHMNL
jgi:hypothetical protein